MNISLREWTKKDVDDLAYIVNNSDCTYMRRVGEGEFTHKDAESQLKKVLSHKNIGHALYRAIVLDGEAIGYISVVTGSDVSVRDGAIGYYLMTTYARRGIMTEAVRMMVDEAFERLDIVRITAYVALHNIASIKVLEHNGFIREGLLHKGAYMNGEYEDVAIYARFRE